MEKNNNVLQSLLSELKEAESLCYIHHQKDGAERHLKGYIVDFDDYFISVRRPLGDMVVIRIDIVTGVDKINQEGEQ